MLSSPPPRSYWSLPEQTTWGAPRCTCAPSWEFCLCFCEIMASSHQKVAPLVLTYDKKDLRISAALEASTLFTNSSSHMFFKWSNRYLSMPSQSEAQFHAKQLQNIQRSFALLQIQSKCSANHLSAALKSSTSWSSETFLKSVTWDTFFDAT